MQPIETTGDDTQENGHQLSPTLKENWSISERMKWEICNLYIYIYNSYEHKI